MTARTEDLVIGRYIGSQSISDNPNRGGTSIRYENNPSAHPVMDGVRSNLDIVW